MRRKSIISLFWISVVIGMVVYLFLIREKTVQNALLSIGVSLLYTLPLAYGNGLMNDYLTRKFSWVEQTRLRVALGIIGTLAINVIGVLAINYINFILIQGFDAADFFSGDLALSNWLTINIALLIAAILHAKGFMEEWKKTAKREVVEQKLIAKSANAQFESLKNQLDPHFLFNSLNVLDALIDENPEQAQRFTNAMSKVYRYVLDQKDKELVTVQEEIDFAKVYCELLETRFEDSVSFEFDVEDRVKQQFVVPLSLQLLLENAIKHNFATSARPLQIRIFSDGQALCIQNNLQARGNLKDRDGIGLANIVQRYALLTKQNVFIEKSDHSFTVRIPILTQKITAMQTPRSTSSDEMIAYEKAAKRVKELKSFYGNITSYCLVIPFLVFVNLYTSPEYHWFWWPMLGWGIGVASHAIQVFGVGKNWEDRKIRELMEKEKVNSK